MLNASALNGISGRFGMNSVFYACMANAEKIGTGLTKKMDFIGFSMSNVMSVCFNGVANVSASSW